MVAKEAPMILKFWIRHCLQRRDHFKFFNCFAQHPKFIEKIQASWVIQGASMHVIWKNLKLVRNKMQKLNKKQFMGVSEKVKQLKKDVKEKQSQMRVAPIPQAMLEEEKRLRSELHKWSHIEETIYR